ncbi:sigma-54 interaction domain-containing protein [Clostridium ganghwense]|uniref:HTH-type transcriptional regulatory protein TyrR n=1 Tax=Clostridium ganghwense TaxID=312089 RepID=A0ABT4CLP8_9CLOT|nr:sigma 54-interacting transcriptional regulator [Clostridium ganghwense]MCY6369967.1 sigma 54-interacting transcriptional regulator [Clostridium ganghwense]
MDSQEKLKTKEKNKIENKLTLEVLKKIINNAFDEIFVYDNNYRVVYANRASERHYGIKATEIIGKTFWELTEIECWYPSILPMIYKEKRQLTIEQKSYLGETLITTGVPIFDINGELEFVVMSVRDHINEISVIREELENNLVNNKKNTYKLEDNSIKQLSDKIIFRSDKMEELLELTKRVAKVDSTIMIQGESGTGKGVIAKYIHKNSKRKNRPLLTINCAAIPEELLESELFGYSKGAFTGANAEGKIGIIELVDKGTLFLDEVAELSPKLQAKILHVIQDKQFIPIGSREIKKVDIRIITATNRDLLKMVENNKFREDLYYRLNVIEIDIPPLRERPEDIVALSNYFINKFNKKYQYSCYISEKCLDFLLNYTWHGNVRQLENVIERLVVTSTKPMIEVSDLPKSFFRDIKSDNDRHLPQSFDLAIEEFEKEVITKAYKKFRTSRKVAEALSVSQAKASRLIKKYCTSEI